MPVNLSGPIAIAIIVIYGLFQGIKWLVSVIKKTPEKEDPQHKQLIFTKERLDKCQAECKEKYQLLQDLKEQQSVFMAHYESEERVKVNMEKRIDNVEKRLFSGNGRDSIETRVALLGQRVEQLENDKPTRQTKATKK